MNKRIKKKHNRKIMIGWYIVNSKNSWNTNTPHWKRVKASGRKRKMYYDIPCTYAPNRNHRVYSPSLVQKALQKALKEHIVRTIEFECPKMEKKETDVSSQYKATYVQHLHNGEVTKYGHIFR